MTDPRHTPSFEVEFVYLTRKVFSNIAAPNAEAAAKKVKAEVMAWPQRVGAVQITRVTEQTGRTR